MRAEFPHTVSYNRFVERQAQVGMHLLLRHRSVDNFVTNLLAGLIAYNLLPKKPALNLEIIDKSRLLTE